MECAFITLAADEYGRFGLQINRMDEKGNVEGGEVLEAELTDEDDFMMDVASSSSNVGNGTAENGSTDGESSSQSADMLGFSGGGAAE